MVCRVKIAAGSGPDSARPVAGGLEFVGSARREVEAAVGDDGVALVGGGRRPYGECAFVAYVECACFYIACNQVCLLIMEENNIFQNIFIF